MSETKDLTDRELLTKLLENSAKTASLVDNLEKSTKKNSEEMLAWAQQFHRMLIDEYAAGAQGNVFAILFVNKTTDERRLTQVIASDFEKAHDITTKILQDQTGSPPSDWMIETYAKQVVPIDTDNKILDRVENKMTNKRPIESYINSLELARDRFSTPAQKKTINAVINKIKKVELNISK